MTSQQHIKQNEGQNVPDYLCAVQKLKAHLDFPEVHALFPGVELAFHSEKYIFWIIFEQFLSFFHCGKCLDTHFLIATSSPDSRLRPRMTEPQVPSPSCLMVVYLFIMLVLPYYPRRQVNGGTCVYFLLLNATRHFSGNCRRLFILSNVSCNADL